MTVDLSKLVAVTLLGGSTILVTWGGCGADGSTFIADDAGSGDAQSEQGEGAIGSDANKSDVLDATLEDADGLYQDGAIPPWDPVWHESAPTDWPEVPGVTLPDCGTGCRVLATTKPDTFPMTSPRVNDRWIVIQGWPEGHFKGETPKAVAVDLQNPDAPRELVVDDGAWLANVRGAGGVGVDGDIAVYVVGSRFDGYIVMRHLVTGEMKYVWRVPMESAKEGGHPGTSGTVIALPYVYWMYSGDYASGMWRFDTRSGNLKVSYYADACEIISGTSTGLGGCASAGVGLIVVDFDHDTASLLPEGVQWRSTNGMLSQDGTDAVWIDFRDPGPNDEHGSFDHPWGGEVYHLDRIQDQEERLTFDTPDTPTMKTSPWAYGGDQAWITKKETSTPNPTGSSVYWYSSGNVVARRKGASAVMLQTPDVGLPKPIDAGVVATWLDPVDGRPWVVLLDWPDHQPTAQQAGPVPGF